MEHEPIEFVTDLFQDNDVKETKIQKNIKQLYEGNLNICPGGRGGKEEMENGFAKKGLGFSKMKTKCACHGECETCKVFYLDVEDEIHIEEGGNIFQDEGCSIAIGRVYEVEVTDDEEYLLTVEMNTKNTNYMDWKGSNCYMSNGEDSIAFKIKKIVNKVTYGQLFYDECARSWTIQKNPPCHRCKKICKATWLSKTAWTGEGEDSLPETWKGYKTQQTITVNLPRVLHDTSFFIDRQPIKGSSMDELYTSIVSNKKLHVGEEGEKISEKRIKMDDDKRQFVFTSQAVGTMAINGIPSKVSKKRIDICYCGYCLQQMMERFQDKRYVKQFLQEYWKELFDDDVDELVLEKKSQLWTTEACTIGFEPMQTDSSFGWVQIAETDDCKEAWKWIQHFLNLCQSSIHVNRSTNSVANASIKTLKTQLSALVMDNFNIAPKCGPTIVMWLAEQALKGMKLNDECSLKDFGQLVADKIENKKQIDLEIDKDNEIFRLGSQVASMKSQIAALTEKLKKKSDSDSSSDSSSDEDSDDDSDSSSDSDDNFSDYNPKTKKRKFDDSVVNKGQYGV